MSSLFGRGLCVTARLDAVCAGRRVRDTHRPAQKGFLRNKNNRLMSISQSLAIIFIPGILWLIVMPHWFLGRQKK